MRGGPKTVPGRQPARPSKKLPAPLLVSILSSQSVKEPATSGPVVRVHHRAICPGITMLKSASPGQWPTEHSLQDKLDYSSESRIRWLPTGVIRGFLRVRVPLREIKALAKDENELLAVISCIFLCLSGPHLAPRLENCPPSQAGSN